MRHTPISSPVRVKRLTVFLALGKTMLRTKPSLLGLLVRFRRKEQDVFSQGVLGTVSQGV